MTNTALEFLRSKNMISPDHDKFIIKGNFGTICLNDLLDEFVKYNNSGITHFKKKSKKSSKE